MEYTVSQILGAVVFVFVFLSMQTKNITLVMLCQIGCNAFGMVSYVLIGGFSGCGIYLVATVQSLIYFYLRLKNKEAPIWLNPIIVAAFIILSLITFSQARDIVPMVAAVLCALGISQKRPSVYRLIMLGNGLTWTVYDLLIEAYAMLASHIFTIISALIGIIRLDVIKKAQK